jgi:TolB-like protein
VVATLPHDLIAELSRLRWLFVIARGSSFRFRGGCDARARADSLDVRHARAVEIHGEAMVAVEPDTQDGGVV